MIESPKFDVKDKGDIGIVALGCSLIPNDGSELWTPRECGLEGDNVDDHALVSPFGVRTDA